MTCFLCRTSPLTVMIFDIADINHLEIALSQSSCFLALIFFLLKLIVPEENAAIILSLFAGKSHMKIELLGSPYFWATNDTLEAAFDFFFHWAEGFQKRKTFYRQYIWEINMKYSLFHGELPIVVVQEYEVNSLVGCYHEYRKTSTPITGDVLQCQMEPDNAQGKYVVAVNCVLFSERQC